MTDIAEPNLTINIFPWEKVNTISKKKKKETSLALQFSWKFMNSAMFIPHDHERDRVSSRGKFASAKQSWNRHFFSLASRQSYFDRLRLVIFSGDSQTPDGLRNLKPDRVC